MKISGEFFGRDVLLKSYNYNFGHCPRYNHSVPPKSYFALNNLCGGEGQMASMVLNDLHGLKRPWRLNSKKIFSSLKIVDFFYRLKSLRTLKQKYIQDNLNSPKKCHYGHFF